jgi:hypothetical protein
MVNEQGSGKTETNPTHKEAALLWKNPWLDRIVAVKKLATDEEMEATASLP